MSIILDALDKAQKDRTEGPMMAEMVKVPAKNVPNLSARFSIRALILMGLIVCLGGGLALYYFFPLRNKTLTGTPTTTFPIKIEKSEAALNEAALATFMNGQYAESLRHWQNLTEFNASNPEAWNNLGLTYKKMGLNEQAEESYQRALKLKPDYAEVLNNIGALYLTQGDPKGAIKALERAIKSSIHYSEAHFNLALALEQDQQTVPAISHYQAFLQYHQQLDPRLKGRIELHIASLQDTP